MWLVKMFWGGKDDLLDNICTRCKAKIEMVGWAYQYGKIIEEKEADRDKKPT